jgi:hypothetical protein
MMAPNPVDILLVVLVAVVVEARMVLLAQAAAQVHLVKMV